jgi:hypothetical protein
MNSSTHSAGSGRNCGPRPERSVPQARPSYIFSVRNDRTVFSHHSLYKTFSLLGAALSPDFPYKLHKPMLLIYNKAA